VNVATEFNFDGRLALVTGSSRGIGKAIALYLARHGCDVIVHYRREADAAESVARQIRGLGRGADTIQADLGDEAATDRLMATVRERYGRLDLLIANAASTAFKSVDETKPHNVDMTFAIVIKSLIQMVQAAVRLMEGRNGKIVTISGFDSVRFIPRHSTLGAAKAGVEALTRYFACEYWPRGISVNCIMPGPTLTDSLRVMLKARGAADYIDALQNRARMTAAGRLTRPEDIAPVVAFLCSEEARWIVGQTIPVDGGFSLGFDPFADRPIEEISVETLGAS
jgi:enoyl-[acyl-carrier protein] reductase III